MLPSLSPALRLPAVLSVGAAATLVAIKLVANPMNFDKAATQADCKLAFNNAQADIGLSLSREQRQEAKGKLDIELQSCIVRFTP